MTSYFIYYRVAPSHATEITSTVNAIFQDVHDATGIRGRLMRRADGSDTWMEIYGHVTDQAAFDTALAQAVDRNRFDKLLAADSKRHIERFVEAAR
jgi:hypothetical protein